MHSMRRTGWLAGVAGVGFVGFFACAGGSPPPAPPPPPPGVFPTPSAGAALPDVNGVDAGGGAQTGAAAVSEGSAAPQPASAAAVQTLARGQHPSAAVAVDRSAVYWIDDTDGVVTRVAKRGGVTMLIYSGGGSAPGAGASIAVDGTDIYWTSQVDDGKTRTSSVTRQDKNGGKPTVVSSSTTSDLRCVTVDDAGIYWVAGASVMRASKAGGGAAVPVAAGQKEANCVAVDDKNAYVSLGGTDAKQHADGAIVVVPKRGGAAKVLVKDAGAAANVLVDDKSVYWIAGDKILKAPKAGGGGAGATPTVLATAGAPIGDAALDGDAVYFTYAKGPADGAVARVAKDGGAVEVLAATQSPPLGIAIESNSAYWTSRDGTVNRIGTR
jgi:hypothetical protein